MGLQEIGRILTSQSRTKQVFRYLLINLTIFMVSACASSPSAPLFLENEETIQRPTSIFGVVGRVYELEFLGDASDYFNGYEEFAHNLLAARIKVEVISNAIGYTNRETLSGLVVVGAASDVDPSQGPIFVIGEVKSTSIDESDDVYIHDWGRLTISMCMRSEILESVNSSAFHALEDRRSKHTNNSSQVSKSTVSDLLELQDSDVYISKDGARTCYNPPPNSVRVHDTIKPNARRRFRIKP
ncbi:hypothetical protein [Fretibacter rubidus]|uniref:hypothetical protein n=1 Tax=Fretibacter rubidus TaxID=570162 RepID=UPI00352A3A6B